MTESDLAYLRKSGGWEIGSGPSVVICRQGNGGIVYDDDAEEGVYAFAFGQKGLMAGLGLQGTKITKIQPD